MARYGNKFNSYKVYYSSGLPHLAVITCYQESQKIGYISFYKEYVTLPTNSISANSQLIHMHCRISEFHDVIGILSTRVLFDFDLQREGFEYIEKHPEIEIMEDYVKARFDYLLGKFPEVKAEYDKVVGSGAERSNVGRG